MIQETLITTVNAQGVSHIAPMGVLIEADQYVILPYKPNLTLNNILETHSAVINYTDDVRVFAGTLTGRRDWPLLVAENVKGFYLANTLAHTELTLTHVQDDAVRPKLFCNAVHSVNHKPFQGFNRAQHAVLEAAILLSRSGNLQWKQITSELETLRRLLEKTAGDREREAWAWLMGSFEQVRLSRAG
ncbi:DUF447 domain-containing protein [Methylomonas sp. AM2-LC]|uniref:DUF447 domain-containing protein n=1 Tax=Methylomonas sp. AM2-LC TaxID=3153301 RepID=UPI0032668F09